MTLDVALLAELVRLEAPRGPQAEALAREVSALLALSRPLDDVSPLDAIPAEGRLREDEPRPGPADALHEAAPTWDGELFRARETSS